MFKKERGITLVALVVTIIVLLILAGVAISLTVGNNGLFSRAKNAANTWREAETNEASEMNSAVTEYDELYNQYFGTPSNPSAVSPTEPNV